MRRTGGKVECKRLNSARHGLVGLLLVSLGCTSPTPAEGVDVAPERPAEEPVLAPRMAPLPVYPPDAVLEEAAPGGTQDDPLTPARIIPPPHALPRFCLDVNPDVVRFVDVPINGPECSRTVHRDAPPRQPSEPIRRSRLCDALTERSDVFVEDDADEPVACVRQQALPHGYAVYSVGTPSFQSWFLVHLRGSSAEIIEQLETYSSGVGNRSEEMRGQRLVGRAGSFTFMWRSATADWDRGWGLFTASEVCMAIRCERDGTGHLCSPARTLRSYGGEYGVAPMDEERSWPEVGATQHQWDCRPGELSAPSTGARERPPDHRCSRRRLCPPTWR